MYAMTKYSSVKKSARLLRLAPRVGKHDGVIWTPMNRLHCVARATTSRQFRHIEDNVMEPIFPYLRHPQDKSNKMLETR
jgi:hypothetical protein